MTWLTRLTQPFRRPAAARPGYASQAAEVEVVEPRTMLDGNITATLLNGQLYLSGDAEANQIEVAIGEDGDVSFASANGTTINGRVAESYTLPGTVDRVIATLRDGDDSILIDDADAVRRPLESVKIFGGRGNDRITFRGFDVTGPSLLAGGLGSDRILLEGTQVSDSLRMSGGRGSDLLVFRGIDVDGEFLASGGRGQDTVVAGDSFTSSQPGEAVVSVDRQTDRFLRKVDVGFPSPTSTGGETVDISDGRYDRLMAALGGLTLPELDQYRPPVDLTGVTFEDGFPPFDFSQFERTSSGLYYRILDPGSSVRPNIAESITVHYEGFLDGGEPFDSSYERGNGPATFPLGNLIAGWQEGLPLIGEGGRIQLLLPPDLAYGFGGARNIPPNSYLFFNVDLFEVS